MGDCCVLLRGRVLLTPPLNPSGLGWGSLWGINWGGGDPKPLQMGPGRFVGNSRQLTITPAMSTFEVIDYTGEGGPACAGADLTGIGVRINLLCHGSDNLALALFGGACRTGDAAVIINELLPIRGTTLHAGDSIFFGSPMVDQVAPISVQVDATTGATTWVEGVDFARTHVGARMLRDKSVDALSTVRVGYTTVAGSEYVEAMTRTSTEVGVVFEGINKFDGSAIVAQLYRLRINASDGINLINDQPGELNIAGSLLPVCAPVGKSRFFRVMRAPSIDACEG
ncbi:MAG: hypothetical protein ACOYB0_08225 [Polynucleobacter sp.]